MMKAHKAVGAFDRAADEEGQEAGEQEPPRQGMPAAIGCGTGGGGGADAGVGGGEAGDLRGRPTLSSCLWIAGSPASKRDRHLHNNQNCSQIPSAKR